MYAEYVAAARHGPEHRKNYEDLALSWQLSKTTVYHAIANARIRAKERDGHNAETATMKPADVIGQIERAWTRLEGLKREVSLVEENLRNLFHQVPKHSKYSKVSYGKAPGKTSAMKPRKMRIHFLTWSTREFELSPLYGFEANHKNTAEEEAYEKHRYVVRELLEMEFARTEPHKSDEQIGRLRKEVDRKKLLHWTPFIMRLRNLGNSWEDLQNGAITEKRLEEISEYLTTLEKKNESEGLAQGA